MTAFEPAVGVARDQYVIGRNAAVGRLDGRTPAVLDAGNRRVLEYRRAQRFGGARFANAEIERVQVAVVVTNEAAVKCIGTEHVARLIAVPDFITMTSAVTFTHRRELVEPAQLAGLGRNFDVTVLEVALNPVS